MRNPGMDESLREAERRAQAEGGWEAQVALERARRRSGLPPVELGEDTGWQQIVPILAVDPEVVADGPPWTGALFEGDKSVDVWLARVHRGRVELFRIEWALDFEDEDEVADSGYPWWSFHFTVDPEDLSLSEGPLSGLPVRGSPTLFPRDDVAALDPLERAQLLAAHSSLHSWFMRESSGFSEDVLPEDAREIAWANASPSAASRAWTDADEAFRSWLESLHEEALRHEDDPGDLEGEVTQILDDGMRAVVTVPTSYGVVAVVAGVPPYLQDDALEVGSWEEHATVEPPEEWGWLPPGIEADDALALVREAALEAWLDLEQDEGEGLDEEENPERSEEPLREAERRAAAEDSPEAWEALERARLRAGLPAISEERIARSLERVQSLDPEAEDEGVVFEAWLAHEDLRRRAGLDPVELEDTPWEQVGGDMNPADYDGWIGRVNGDDVEIREIMNVENAVGRTEAAEVGHPWWAQQWEFRAEDLALDNEEARNSIESHGEDWLSLDTYAAVGALHRAAALAEIWGMSGGPQHTYDVTGEGWAADVLPPEGEPVTWWGGETTDGPEAWADDEEQFRRDVLLEEDPDDLEAEVEQLLDDGMRAVVSVRTLRGVVTVLAGVPPALQDEARRVGSWEEYADVEPGEGEWHPAGLMANWVLDLVREAALDAWLEAEPEE